MSRQPTNLTSPSHLVGTLRYMAPEQLRGHAVDARTDIFAFGAVLFEMLTLAKAFDGEHDASVMRALLERDPPAPSTINPRVPPHIDRLVLECLAKDPRDRWQSAGDIRRQLASVSESATTNLAVPQRPRRKWLRLPAWSPWAIAIAALAALATASLLRRTGAPVAAAPVLTGTVALPALARPAAFALSRDGTRLAYIRRELDGTTRVALRELSGAEVHTLPGTEGATSVFFGPDRNTLAVANLGELSRIDTGTGAKLRLCSAQDEIVDGTWDESAGIVIATVSGRLIRTGHSGWEGSQSEPVFNDIIPRAHPRFAPGGRHLFYTVHEADSALHVRDMKTGEQRKITRVTSGAEFLDGYLIYEEESMLATRTFSFETGAIGRELNLRSTLHPGRRGMPFALSRTGVLVFQEEARGASVLTWVDATGRPTRRLPLGLVTFSVALAPDGKQTLFSSLDPLLRRKVLHLLSEDGAHVRIATEEQVDVDDPLFAPDGQGFAYVAHRMPSVVLRRERADAAPVTLYTAGSGAAILADWSRDGRWLVLVERRNSQRSDLVLLDLQRHRSKAPRFPLHPWADQVRLSPDRTFVAYSVFDHGMWRVMAMALRDGAIPVPISGVAGLQPRFSADGQSVVFLRLDGVLMNVPVLASDPTPTFGPATELFATGIRDPSPLGDDVTVMGDGSGYLLSGPDAVATPVTLVATSDWRTAFFPKGTR